MRLGGLIAVVVLVLVTLVQAFPQVQGDQVSSGSNIADHMGFNRELADHAAKLDTLKSQQSAVADLPVRMARIEERLDLLSRMIYSLLVGVFMLLARELWGALRFFRSRMTNVSGGGEHNGGREHDGGW
jgi:hypothetical protein